MSTLICVNMDLILGVFLKIFQILMEVDWSKAIPNEISQEIHAAKNLDEVHIALAKLRKKVTTP